MASMKQICIFGGMHGNEMSGVHLVRKWEKNPESVTRSTFQTKMLIANPIAVKLVRRYKDVDLNRQMSPENFKVEINENTPYEVRRAKELKGMLSEGGEIGECEFILDLHNTTANNKVSLLHMESNDFNMHLMHYVSAHLPEGMCYIMSLAGNVSYDSGRGLGKYGGVGIEVGPQPQGVLRADIMSLQESSVHFALDFIENYNNGEEFPEVNFSAYKAVTKIPYPQDVEGHLTAMIHPSLQDQDWKLLTLNDPVFLSFDGNVLYLKDIIEDSSSGPFYPAFINEAAYYEKGIAFYLTTQYNVCAKKLSKKSFEFQ
uniref:aspartoacylase-like n=1 Tax=Styela clava TaxID=7725 RepID=UPI00193AC58D|nr:aspartoacylase-like [Styela clava]